MVSTGFNYNASTRSSVQFAHDRQYNNSKLHNQNNNQNMNMPYPMNNNNNNNNNNMQMQMPQQQQQQQQHLQTVAFMSHHCRTETDMSNSNSSIDSTTLSQSQLALPFDNSPLQSTHTPSPHHHSCNNYNTMQQQQHVLPPFQHNNQNQHVGNNNNMPAVLPPPMAAGFAGLNNNHNNKQSCRNNNNNNNNKKNPSRSSTYHHHRTTPMNNGPCYNQQILNGTIPFNCRHNNTITANSSMTASMPEQQQQPQGQNRQEAVTASSIKSSCDEADSIYINNTMTMSQLSPDVSPSALSRKTAGSHRSSSPASTSDGEARNIKVTGLPRECTNNELRALFEFYFGPVISSVVMLNRRGQSRGYGFVLMQHQEHAEVALTRLEQRTVSIRGQTIGAHLSRKGEVTSSVIFIGNIPHVLTDTLLHQALRQIGKVAQYRMTPGREYRSATVELKDVDAAVQAVQRFHGATKIEVGEVCVSLPVPLYAKFTRPDDSRDHSSLVLRPQEDGHQVVVEGTIAASVPPPPGLLCGLWSEEVEQDEAVSRLVERVRNLSRMKLPLKERTVKKYFHKFLDCPETPQCIRDEFYALARHHQLEVYKTLC